MNILYSRQRKGKGDTGEMKTAEIKKILHSIIDAKPSDYQNYGNMAKDFKKKAEKMLKIIEE